MANAFRGEDRDEHRGDSAGGPRARGQRRAARRDRHERRDRADGLPTSTSSARSSRSASRAASPLGDGDVLWPEPVLVGRSERKLAGARRSSTGSSAGRTDLDAALADPGVDDLLRRPGHAAARRTRSGRRSRPASTSTARSRSHRDLDERAGAGPARARRRRQARRRPGQALPARACCKLKRLHRRRLLRPHPVACAASSATGSSRATGRRRSGRPGTTAREDGGGIVVDMFPHWRYVLDDAVRPGARPCCALGATHIPQRWDEHGRAVRRHRRRRRLRASSSSRAALIAQINSSWCVRVNRDELVEFQVDGTEGSAVAGLRDCRVQHRGGHAEAGLEPGHPDPDRLPRRSGRRCPDNAEFDNGFKVQWELFLRHVALDEPFPWDFLAGASGVQLAELGPEQSSARAALGRGAGAGAVTRRTLAAARGRRAASRTRPARRAARRSPPAPPRLRVASTPPRTSSPTRCADATPTRPGRSSTGTRRSPSAATCGRTGSASPRRWTPPSAAWAWTGPATQRADPPLGRRGAGRRRAHRLRRGHRPARRPAGARWTRSARRTRSSARSSRAPGAQAILMASRALAAAARGPDDYREVYGHLLGAGSSEPVILHWLGADVRPGAARATGASTDLDAAADTLARRSSPRTPTRSTASRSRCSTPSARSRCAARLPEGVRLLHRRRLQLPRADPRRRAGLQRRAARHLRRDRAGRGGGAARARRRRPRRATSEILDADRRRSSRHIFAGADLLLQDRASSSWPGSTATRSTSGWSAGWRARARSLHLAELFVLADRAGLLRDPELAARGCGTCSRSRGERVSDRRRRLSLNQMTVDQLGAGRGGRRAAPRAGIAVDRACGAHKVAEVGVERGARG